MTRSLHVGIAAREFRRRPHRSVPRHIITSQLARTLRILDQDESSFSYSLPAAFESMAVSHPLEGQLVGKVTIHR